MIACGSPYLFLLFISYWTSCVLLLISASGSTTKSPAAESASRQPVIPKTVKPTWLPSHITQPQSRITPSPVSPSSPPTKNPSSQSRLPSSRPRKVNPTSPSTMNPLRISTVTPSSPSSTKNPSSQSRLPSSRPRRVNPTSPSTMNPLRISTVTPSSPSSTKTPSSQSRLPSSKPSRVNSTSPSTENPSRLTAPSIATPFRQYSNLLFLGDSLFNFWICTPANSVLLHTCGNYVFEYFNKSSHLLVNCSNSTTLYCLSLFQAAFPGALNLAYPGYSIEDVANFVTTSPYTTALAEIGAPTYNNVTLIVVQAGTNNLGRLQNKVEEFIPKYFKMLQSIHDKFPKSQILLLAIPPNAFIETGRPKDINTLRARINALMNSSFSNNLSYPYVKFGDHSNFFKDAYGAVNQSYFLNDSIHFSPLGYTRLEAGIKYYIDEYYEV